MGNAFARKSSVFIIIWLECFAGVLLSQEIFAISSRRKNYFARVTSKRGLGGDPLLTRVPRHK